MIVINKSVFCGNLDDARLLGHPVYFLVFTKSHDTNTISIAK